MGLDALMPRYYEIQQRALTRGGGQRNIGAPRNHKNSQDNVVNGQINHGFWTRTRQNSFVAPISDTDEEVSFTQGPGLHDDLDDDDDKGWIDYSALLPLNAAQRLSGGKRRILNMK